jgi:hypothetical protein
LQHGIVDISRDIAARHSSIVRDMQSAGISQYGIYSHLGYPSKRYAVSRDIQVCHGYGKQ